MSTQNLTVFRNALQNPTISASYPLQTINCVPATMHSNINNTTHTVTNSKKRKQREFDQPVSIKKRAKRCSKKFIAQGSSTEPNSHITITFGIVVRVSFRE